jgi:hypothetical protein
VDEYRHYLCSPKSLTKLVFGLSKYDFSLKDAFDKNKDAVGYECKRAFRDRIVNQAGKERFD